MGTFYIIFGLEFQRRFFKFQITVLFSWHTVQSTQILSVVRNKKKFKIEILHLYFAYHSAVQNLMSLSL